MQVCGPGAASVSGHICSPCHVWGCIDECVPVCLCIYESYSCWGRRGGSQVQLGKLSRGGGRLCPFSSPTSFTSCPCPASWGLSPPCAHFPSLPKRREGASCPPPSPPQFWAHSPMLSEPSGHWGVWGLVVGAVSESR